MRTAVARLIAATLMAWIILVWPARLLWGADVPARSLAACLLCLVPAALTLAWAVAAAGGKPEQQLAVVLGGMLVRMVMVLAGALVLFFQVPILHDAGFWMWVLGFYLLTLALEIALVLAHRSAAAAPPAAKEQPAIDTLSQEG